MKKIEAFAALLIASFCLAQVPEANYDEAKVSQFTLPDPLVMASGERVGSAQTWQMQRRPEILRLFETHVYGRSPGRLQSMSFGQPVTEKNALGGQAVRKEVSVYF